MRISMEIFNIPEDALDNLRRVVYDSYEKFLHQKKESDTIMSLRGGTCPLSGKKYMHVEIQSNQSMELGSLNRFSESIYAHHPLREDDLVIHNRQVKIEDSSSSGEPDLLPEGLEEGVLGEGEMSCWICGRFEGEEYIDCLTNNQLSTEIHIVPEIQVPLCVVCARILHRSSSIE